MVTRLPLMVTLIAVLASFGTGCRYKIVEDIEEIQCHYKFQNVERVEDRQRIADVIRQSAVPESIQTLGTATNPEYMFKVKDSSALDKMHPRLIYANPTAQSSDLHQVFNPSEPFFSITYSTIDIGGQIETLVRFRITPGARLYFKPPGEPEKDVTELVDKDGNVRLPIPLRRDEPHVFARSVSGKVQRFIRINVYTKEVQQIPEREYPTKGNVRFRGFDSD